MKHRVPRKWVLLAVVVLMMLAFHVAALHTLVNVGVRWWLVIAGITLVVTVKTLVIVTRVRNTEKISAPVRRGDGEPENP